MLLFAAGEAASKDRHGSVDLFRITSNITRSWMQYSVKITGRSFIDDNPVHAFRKRPGGSSRNMNFFERRYYDFYRQKIIDGKQLEFSLRAAPSIKVKVTIHDKVLSYVLINNRWCLLKGVHLILKKGFIVTFNHAEVTGIDTQSGRTIKKRFYKKDLR